MRFTQLHSTTCLVLAAAACGAPSQGPRAPATASNPATPLTAIGTHDAFCAAPREGCTRSCLAAPAWSSKTPTFTHAELWAYQDHCADDAVQLTRCTLAIERAGVWYDALDTVCKSEAMPHATTSLDVSRVQSRDGIDAFEYTVTGTLFSSDEGEDGKRVDSTIATSRRFVTVCGVGSSRVPSCLDSIYVGGNGMGDPYAERTWELDDGGVVRLGAFPEGQVPDVSDDDGGAATFRVDLP